MFDKIFENIVGEVIAALIIGASIYAWNKFGAWTLFIGIPLLIVVIAYYVRKNRKKTPPNPTGVKLPFWKTFKTPLICAGVLLAAAFASLCFPQVRSVAIEIFNNAFGGGTTTIEDTSVQYIDTEVSFYAGGGSAFADYAELTAPRYIDENGGVLYVWDSGSICELRPTWMRKYEIGKNAIDALHVWKGDVYALTTPWETHHEDSEYYDYKFTILRARGEDKPESGADSNVRDMLGEPFYAGDGVVAMRFTDFALSSNGNTLWVTPQDVGIGAGNVVLKKITYDVDEDLFPIDKLEWFADLAYDVTDHNLPRLAMDDKDNLYFSSPEDHEIRWFDFEHNAQDHELLVGDHLDGRYQDGADPRFLMPTSIAVKGEYLYVYDSGAVRRVSLKDGSCVTLAGRVLQNGEEPLSVPNSPEEKIDGKDAVFPCGEYPGMTVLDDGTVLLCNDTIGVIYQIAERKGS